MGLLPLGLLPRLLFPAALVLLIGMWYYTNQLNKGAFIPDNSAPPPNVRVVEVAEGRVRLAPLEGEESAWDHDGLYGLEFEGGYARIGRVIDDHPDSVLRELIPVSGTLEAGSEARVDTFVSRGDPKTAVNLDFEDVTVTTPAGEAPAWFVPGDAGDTWVIFVHGKGSNREEAFRVLPTLHELGLPVLLITYRNDPEYTEINDGRYGYGETEWQDVAAAMDYARSRGAQRFVLEGNSMGGAIVMGLLQQPEYAAQVGAVILDAPVLNLRQTVEYRASQKKLPSVFTKLALQFASVRNGVDWTKTNYLSDTSGLKAPILLFHGAGDRVVSVATSRSLAQARPDLVTYHEMAGVDHVQSWNADRELYSLRLKDFLMKNLPKP
jgi:pimeloyl-ACP methyl ester carboxylesterase